MESHRCALCEREVSMVTEHHLVPVSVGRKRGRKAHELPTVDLCYDCHRQIHHLFDNRELATRLSSVEALRAEPQMQGYLRWIRRQPGTRRFRFHRSD